MNEENKHSGSSFQSHLEEDGSASEVKVRASLELNQQNDPSAHKPTAYILVLIASFPCLNTKRGDWFDESGRFDPDKFHLSTNNWSDGEKYCAAFVLNVWNPDARLTEFPFFEFAATADVGDRKVVLDWLAKPTWP